MRVVAGAALLACAVVPTSALAHQAGLSRGVYAIQQGRVDASLAFARLDVAAALEVQDSAIHTSADLDALAPALRRVFVEGLRVRTGDGACAGSLASATVDEQDGVLVALRFDCPSSPAGATTAELVVEAGFVDALGAGHRHVARLEVEPPTEEVLFTGKSTLRAAIPPMRGSVSAADAVAGGFLRTTASLATPLFAFALAAPAPRASRALLAVAATALGFTLGAFVVARAFAPSASLVAALSALAVVYVGLDASLLAGGLDRDGAARSDVVRAALGASFGLVLGAHAAPALGGLPGGAACVLLFGAIAAAAGAILRRWDRDGARTHARSWIMRSVTGLAAAAGVALLVKSLVH